MTDSIEGIQLDRLTAISFVGAGLRNPDRVVIACPAATVGKVAQLVGEMKNLSDWGALIEGGGGWAALVNTQAAIQTAADDGDFCVTLIMRREDGERFAAACGYEQAPGSSWMVFAKVVNPDVAVERPVIPPLFYAALELEDPASAARLLGDGEDDGPWDD